MIRPETKYSELNYSPFLIEEKGKVIGFNRPANNELFLIYDIVGNFLIDRENLENMHDEDYEQFYQTKKFSDELLKFILYKGPKDLKPLEGDLIKINSRFAFIHDNFSGNLTIEFYDVFKDLAAKMIKLGGRIKRLQ